MLLAIDPGDFLSAYVLYDDKNKVVVEKGKCENLVVRNRLSELRKQTDILAIEMIASYGLAVGKTVFETCVWIGRYWEVWGGKVDLVYRKDVKVHLCRSVKAKDSNIRQAIIDLFPRTGKNSKGEPCSIGCKGNPGPLYGVSKDIWAALGVAITYAETHIEDLK